MSNIIYLSIKGKIQGLISGVVVRMHLLVINIK